MLGSFRAAVAKARRDQSLLFASLFLRCLATGSNPLGQASLGDFRRSPWCVGA